MPAVPANPGDLHAFADDRADAGAITVAAEQQRPRTLTPTGKREKQTVGSVSLDVATRWEGPHRAA